MGFSSLLSRNPKFNTAIAHFRSVKSIKDFCKNSRSFQPSNLNHGIITSCAISSQEEDTLRTAASDQRQRWIENGHGVYTDLNRDSYSSSQHGGDVAKAFFEAAKRSDRLVIHFHRATTRSCDVFHRALSELAPKHPETKFVKIDVEGCDDVRESGSGVGAKYLVEKLGIAVMPTLLFVKERKAEYQWRGFDELGGSEEFSVNELAYVLGGAGALTRREEEEETPRWMEEGGRGNRVAGVNSLKMQFGGGRKGPRSGGFGDDYDQD